MQPIALPDHAFRGLRPAGQFTAFGAFQEDIHRQLDAGRARQVFLRLQDAIVGKLLWRPALMPLYREATWRGVAEAHQRCDWADYELMAAAMRDAIEHDPTFWMAGEITLAVDGLTRNHLLEMSRRHGARFGAPAPDAAYDPPGHPLRVGVIGCDFHAQATACLFTGVVEAMDRERVHLTAYDYGRSQPDAPWRSRCLAAYDRFVRIQHMTDADGANQIRADRIDVLIHMRDAVHGRLGICALRPAAIQIQYLYFPGTSGAAFMDYLIADEIVVPPGHEDGYAETVLRLDGCYQPNDRNRPVPRRKPRQHYGLGPDWQMLANFSQNYKFTPAMFGHWCEILRRDERRRLWLLDAGEPVEINLRREAAARGITPDRLIFAPRASSADHLARLAAADLVLDTFPYGGHTLTSDALWAGTPVVSLAGETFASRVAASLLVQSGVPELAAASAKDYVEMADALLRSPELMATKRAAIVEHRAKGSLFDAPAYAERLTQAFETLVTMRWRPRETDLGPECAS